MKKLKNKFKINSLKWQLLFSLLIILVILLITMGIFQSISMEKYLCEDKRQVLQQRFHNLDFSKLSKENLNTITKTEAMEILNRVASKNIRAFTN